MLIRKGKHFSLLIAVIVMICATTNTASAARIEPRFNNTVSASSTASITDSGLLTITNQFKGIKDKTTTGEITTYIEKKSGLTWDRINIGSPDNQWCDVVNDYTYIGSHTFQLSSRGTYRVTAIYVISGSGGGSDTITRTITKTY